MEINCYAAMEAKQPLVPFQYESNKLKPTEVLVAITHCGICHSDLHLIDNDWGVTKYPFVPGHEIVGTIVAAGENVKDIFEGQRVGIGWECNSCGHCEWCKQGDEHLCATQTATCIGREGGFAKFIQVESHFAIPIPDALASAEIAPLFCGGATVYSPLRQYTKQGSRVGIIGIGGLGHLALQFAKALGCEVTAFSSSPEKKTEAEKLGADHFINSADPAALKQAAYSLDFILSTATASLNWPIYLNMLRPNGRLCFVGPAGNIDIPIMTLIGNRKGIVGSNIASVREIKEMLQFAAKHQVKAQIELFPLKDVNQALDKLRANKIHYRAVLQVA